MLQIAENRLEKQDYLIMAALFTAMLLLLSQHWLRGHAEEFAGIFGDVTTTSADRVRAGDIPYRDFWTMYAPGSFYLLGLLFDIFGHHITVASAASSAFFAAAACACYRLVLNLTDDRAAAIACAAIFAAAVYSTNYYLSLGPYPVVIFCILLTLNLVVNYHRSGSLAALFAAGLVIGVSIVFKHDVGGYTAIAIVAGIVARHFRQHGFTADALGALAGHIMLFSVGAGIVFVPVAVYFAWLAGYDMWYDLIVFPATDFKFARGEIYPGLLPGDLSHEWWLKSVFKFLDYLRYNVPLLVVFLVVVVSVYSIIRKKEINLPILLTIGLLYLFHYTSAHVQINTNIISMPLYAAILGSITLVSIGRQLKPRAEFFLRTVALGIAGVLFTAYFAQPVYGLLRGETSETRLTLPGISGITVTQEYHDVLEQLVEYVDEHVPPDKRLFIGLHRHDTVIVGDGKMYFILNRLNATRQDQLHPGIVDTARVQQEMIRDLKKHDVRHIILRHVFKDDYLDKMREEWSVTLPNSGATDLDEYIRSNYTQVKVLGQYEIWRRNDDLPVAAGK